MNCTFLLIPLLLTITAGCTPVEAEKKPNVIFIYADQWRAQDMGYAGNTDVKTPNFDKLAGESVVFNNAVSGMPVCTPYRASLLTGQYWLTHGLFYNDKPLDPNANSIAKVYKQAGYDTGYIGKWHLNGHPTLDPAKTRDEPVTKARRQGFDYWKVREVTHKYNDSFYFDENNERHVWEGYDAFAQTKDAINYIKDKSKGDKPFVLFLAWGPPHDPYQSAPEKYKKMFDNPEILKLRPNVPDSLAKKTRQNLAGYYAHMAALDDSMGELLQALKVNKIDENTIVVFTSDHGDMMSSQGGSKKQQPWDESIKIPFILRYPAKLGKQKRSINMPINVPDVMPTLLSLSGISIPATVEGEDYAGYITGEKAEVPGKGVLIACPVPFHNWNYSRGGREYRGVRTERYTYVKDLKGPWLLYDNQQDPYQMKNLVNNPAYKVVQSQLEKNLQGILKRTKDEFKPGDYYMKKWGYAYDHNDADKKN